MPRTVTARLTRVGGCSQKHSMAFSSCDTAGPAAAEINFDSARSGAPAQNKDAVNLPSTFFKAGGALFRLVPLHGWGDVWGGGRAEMSLPGSRYTPSLQISCPLSNYASLREPGAIQ